MDDKQKAIATLIYWSPDVDKARIERWLKKLREHGHIEGETTREYNPEYGNPVWYIP